VSQETHAASRFRSPLASERRSADLYSRLADAATGERREVLGELAAVECKHAAHWAAKLNELGEPVPPAEPAGLRPSALSWLARRFSIDAMLPYLKRAEHADAGLYQGDPDATAAMAVDERSHARVLTRLRTTDPSGIRKVERWHRGDRSGALRAAVFGVNDGLVSNSSRCASPSTTSVSVRVPSVWVAHRATDEHRFHSIESTAGEAHENRGQARRCSGVGDEAAARTAAVTASER
jgi:hypothetical protein